MTVLKILGNTPQFSVDRISAGEQIQELITVQHSVKGDVKLKERKVAYDEIPKGTNNVVIAIMALRRWELIFLIFNLGGGESGKSFGRVIQPNWQRHKKGRRQRLCTDMGSYILLVSMQSDI